MEPRPDNILSIEELAQVTASHRQDGQKVVMCHGVFDLVHIGHIRHFEQAQKNGDILVVTLTPDRYVNKGVNRPAFPEPLRAEAVSALAVVDYVAINNWPTAEETIRLLRPDVFCKGGEYRRAQVDATTNLQPEVRAAAEVGAKVVYTEDVVFSSSKLLNQHFSPFPQETDEWLDSFRTRVKDSDIAETFDRMKDLKVLVVGETILDEYVICNSIGKSTKDPILATQYVSEEKIGGGALAIANHLAGFCDHVGLVTCLGDSDRSEEFVTQALRPNVRPTFVTKHDSPTITKRRFVDQYSQNKLLELYVMDDRPLDREDETRMIDTLEQVLPEYDVVIAADYGHGVLTQPVIDTLCRTAPFLAVNTQSNAGNRGFNPVSKYKRADYVCLANHEIAVETRNRQGHIKDLLLEVTRRISCPVFTVTLGKAGSLHYAQGCGFTEVPAFATSVTDRVGAGDGVLAITSLLVRLQSSQEMIGFIGNVAGAQMVSDLGNRSPLDRIPLAKHITALLK